MTNRLRNLLRTISCCVGLLFSLAIPSQLYAQMGFFNFSYNGPDSLTVGIDCNLALQGNIPDPVVTSTIGATIVTSMFSPDSSHFQYTDLWTMDETAHVYWYVADNMGHSYYFDFFILFVDHMPPTFDLTGINDTLFYNSIVQVPAPPNIPIMDNCTGFTLQYVETTKPDTCEAGQFTRTWTATDQKGNTSTFTQWIIIAADVTPPTIVFAPQNGSSPCETLSTTYPAWLAAQMAAFTANDPSGIKSLTNNGPATFPPGCKVPLTVTFKATDNCNLMIPTTAVFSTSDNQGPVVTVAPKDTIAYCSPGGNHIDKLKSWISNHGYMQAMDGCSPPLTYIMKMNNVVKDSAAVVAAFWQSFDNACGTQLIGTQQVNQVSAFVRVDFTVEDACGKPTFAGTATFGAVDTLPPVISGAGITEQCGGGNDQTALQNWINAKANATVMDDCSAAFWTNFTYVTSTGNTGSGAFDFGPYPTLVANNCNWFVDVTFHASDECGNDAGKTHRFQIVDTQVPVITGLAPNITVYCPNPLPTVPAATITDNCDASISTSFTRMYIDSICAGSYTVLTTWTATDDCGNSTTVTQNIFVRDTTRPVFTLVPIGLLMRCDTFVLPPIPVQGQNINANDLCSPVISINTATVSTQNPDPTNCQHYSYHYTRTFTATDQCGNTQTATQIISVIDNQPPVPGGVLDTTALCSGLTPFPAPIPTPVDVCGGPTPPPIPVDTIIIPGGCAGQYTIQRVWVARDYCFNQTTFNQIIHVIDSVAPTLVNIPANITTECDAIPDPPDPVGFNGADNCAASVSVTLQESEIRNPDTTNCDHWTNYILHREWTVSDDCGNMRTYTQEIQIVDNTPPELVAPENITLSNDPGDCGTTLPIPAPVSLSDVCSAGIVQVVLKDTLPILPLTPPYNSTTPVDTIVVHFAVPNSLPGQPAVSQVSLDIYIERADADGMQEYFKVYGEDGFYIDKTNPTPGLCSSIPGITNLNFSAAQFNDWASDGEITITLAPNGFAGSAINPTCDNSQIRAHLTYSYATPNVPLDLQYSLDGAAFSTFPPMDPAFLAVGTHTVVYSATDCSDNTSTASMQIVVQDTEPPVIAAPAPIITYVSPGACVDTIILPFPAISENCKMSGHLNKSSIFSQIQFIEDPDFGDIPADVILSIPGVKANAISNGELTIKFRGDNADPREFFNIFHNLTLVDTTNLGTVTGECGDTVLTIIDVTPAQINLWAAGGNAVFTAKPNTVPGGVPLDFDFINPCGALLPNSTWDGTSQIQAMLEYDFAVIDFVITQNSNGQPFAMGAVEGTQTMVPNLPPGNYTIKYTTTDNSGLMGMTTFPLTVRDTIKPKAMCKPSLFIQVNPSGVNNYMMQPSEINNGSTDNCPGTLNYSLSQSVFTCNSAGTSTQVMLTVTDNSGNTASCSTTVFIQLQAPMPTNSPICEGDTLFLFANPPTPGLFNYSWTHPFVSVPNVPNPVLPNVTPSYQGTYTVKITGSTGCMSSGSVTVNFANLTTPGFSVSGGNGTNFCQGQPVTLNATFPTGNNVSYLWYQTGVPNPTLLQTTSINFYTLNNLAPGQYTFYVKVKIGDCLTSNSLAVTINVFARPPATVVDNFIQVCAGQPLAFSTNVTGVSYFWQGPLGWTSNLQHPLVNNTVALTEEGFYTLTTSQNGCISIPSAVVEVDVKYTPPMPLITGITTVCTGEDVTLTANVVSQFLPVDYLWQSFPSAPVSTGTANTLVVQDVTPADCGNWRVRASFENCPSEWSDAVMVCAENYPDVTAAANSPICQDSTLKLMATGSSGIVDWSWILPGNSIIYAQNPSITPGLPGLYRVVGKTIYGCSDTASVLVLGSIAPVIDTINIIAPICANGMPAQLIPTVSSFNGPFTYHWTHNSETLILKDPTYTINPFGPSNGGAYTLVVKDTFGCPSVAEIVFLSVQAAVATPNLVITDNFVCEGDDVEMHLSNNYSQSPTFYWITPQDTIITSTAQLFLNDVTLAQNGDYTVFVQIGDCYSGNSLVQSLTVNPIPAVPVMGDIGPVCSGTSLQLFVNPSIPFTNYQWNGPGYMVTALNPVINNMTEAREGYYYVRAEKAGCLSAPDSAYVYVMALPNNPLISTQDPHQICLEPIQPNALIRVSQGSQTPGGALYTWINPATNDTLFGPSTDFTLNFIDLDPQFQTAGPHLFSVIAWLPDVAAGGGCSSQVSPGYMVQFDTMPANQAACDDDHKACASSKVCLVATQPSGTLTGMWNQISLPIVALTNPDSSVACFSGVAGNTYRFVWSLSNGGCLNFSSDTLEIMVVAPEKSNAGKDTTICDDSGFTLNAVDGINTEGMWSQLNQFVTIVDSFESKSPVTGMIPGNTYFFVWSLSDIGCGISADTVRVQYYSSKPNITGNSYVCTGMNETLLTAPELANFEMGVWSSQTGLLSFNPQFQKETVVKNLVPGANVVYWTINNGICGSNSRDTFVVNYEIYPIAQPDTFYVEFGNAITFDVRNNDQLPTPWPIPEIRVQAANGIADTLPNGAITYKPNSGFSGKDIFEYKICNEDCGDNACSVTHVVVYVGEAGECYVPTIITPNNDGLNDYFQLPPECYLSGEGEDAVVEVTIFNQWGDYVYHKISSEEPSGVITWDGKYNGKELPAGTYYYIVKFEGALQPKSGFLLIQY